MTRTNPRTTALEFIYIYIYIYIYICVCVRVCVCVGGGFALSFPYLLEKLTLCLALLTMLILDFINKAEEIILCLVDHFHKVLEKIIINVTIVLAVVLY